MRSYAISVVLTAVLGAAALVHAAEPQAADHDRELSNLKSEVRRLKKIVEKKDSALDVAIREIKKLRAEEKGTVPSTNAEDKDVMAAAFDGQKWEPAEFTGIGKVFVKPTGNNTIIKVTSDVLTAALERLGQRSQAHYGCGGMHCFVISTNALTVK